MNKLLLTITAKRWPMPASGGGVWNGIHLAPPGGQGKCDLDNIGWS
jgi:hypothetical protein